MNYNQVSQWMSDSQSAAAIWIETPVLVQWTQNRGIIMIIIHYQIQPSI